MVAGNLNERAFGGKDVYLWYHKKSYKDEKATGNAKTGESVRKRVNSKDARKMIQSSIRNKVSICFMPVNFCLFSFSESFRLLMPISICLF